MGRVLIIICGFLLGASVSIAALPSSAATAKKVELLKLAKQTIATLEASEQLAVTKFLSSLDAHAAEDAYDCFYGGWQSQSAIQGSKRVCTSPKGRPGYEAGVCDSSELHCNPMLFGSGICVSTASLSAKQRVFSNCENSFQKNTAGKKDQYDFLASVDQGKLNGLLDMVEKVCGDSSKSFQSSKPMCARFIQKKKEIEQIERAPVQKSEKVKIAEDKKPEEKKSEEKKEPEANTEYDYEEDVGSYISANNRGPSPGGGSKRPVGLYANKPCSTCGPGAANTPSEALKQLEKTIKDAEKREPALQASYEFGDPHSLYEEIKKKYQNSDKCGRYNELSVEERRAFFVHAYSIEVKCIRSPCGAYTDDALTTQLQAMLNWSDDQARSWLRSLEASRSGSLDSRLKMQADIIKAIAQRSDDSEFRVKSKPRVQSLMDRYKMKDCEFISEAAFTDALKARSAMISEVKDKNRITIMDRSLPKTDRRMIVIDLKSKDVLFHSITGFGMGKGKGSGEDPQCNNRPESNKTPYGGAIVTDKRWNSGGDWKGIFMQTQSGSSTSSLNLHDRKIAIHEVDVGKTADIQITQSSEYLKRVGNQATQKNVDNFLAQPPLMFYSQISTIGCAGLPPWNYSKAEKYIDRGSFVYFHCPPGMRK